MWERCVSFPSELDHRLFSRGGGLEAGSELSAWTETSQAVSPTRPSIPGYSRLSTRLFGGGRGAGAIWIMVGGDNIRY